MLVTTPYGRHRRLPLLAAALSLALLAVVVHPAAGSVTVEGWSDEGQYEPGDVVHYSASFPSDGPRLTAFTVGFEHSGGTVVERDDPSPEDHSGSASWLVRPETTRGTWTISYYEVTFADGTTKDGAPNDGAGVEFQVVEAEPEDTSEDEWIVQGFPCRSPQRFRDNCPDSPHVFDVHDLALAEITSGCAEHYFCPDDPVTRGQMAAFLTRALDLPQPDTVRFTDTGDSVFLRDIEAIAEADVTRGCNPPANDHYCPDAPVTRDQMAAFVVRALGLPTGAGGRFADVDSSHRFHDDIAALAAAGITRGCDPPANDHYCPDAPVTRAQMATFLYRAGVVT